MYHRAPMGWGGGGGGEEGEGDFESDSDFCRKENGGLDLCDMSCR